MNDLALKVDEIDGSVLHEMRSEESKPRAGTLWVECAQADASALQGVLLVARISRSKDTSVAYFMRGVAPAVIGAIGVSRTVRSIPPVLLNHVAQMKSLQETVVTLTVVFEQTLRVSEANRAEVQPMSDGLWHVAVHFGFIEVPNLVSALMRAKELGCPVRLDDAVYFAASDEVVRSQKHPDFGHGSGRFQAA